jgi:hypothetical protein
MVISAIIIVLLCFLLSRLTLTTHKKLWRFFAINLAIMIFYNIVTWCCVSVFWHSGGEGVIPIFCDIVLTAVHLLVLLIVLIVNAVKGQRR